MRLILTKSLQISGQNKSEAYKLEELGPLHVKCWVLSYNLFLNELLTYCCKCLNLIVRLQEIEFFVGRKNLICYSALVIAFACKNYYLSQKMSSFQSYWTELWPIGYFWLFLTTKDQLCAVKSLGLPILKNFVPQNSQGQNQTTPSLILP